METVLIVDNDNVFKQNLKLFLSGAGYLYFEAKDAASALNIISKQQPGLIIAEADIPEINGLELLRKAKDINPANNIIITSNGGDLNLTITAMQMGALDHIDKSAEFSRLTLIIRQLFENKKINDSTPPILLPHFETGSRRELVGSNPVMKELYRKIGTVSSNRVNILIEGESGTGKELVARTIHSSGITRDMPFVAVNCTVLSETLLESELFGHVKGAFTGAIRDKKGKFELAGQGTIFLDEISEISPNLQVKLLRVLQEKEFEKVGGEATIPVRARIIAASNKDLKKLVCEGKFRQDLYYRLKVFQIDVPPLRDRKDDIPRLAVYFLQRINIELNKNVRKIPYQVMEMLQNFQWPGNVRELENVLTEAVILVKGEILEKDYIKLQENNLVPHKTDGNRLSLAEMERKHILQVLSFVNWNKQSACRILKVSRATLYSKIRSYKIEENPQII